MGVKKTNQTEDSANNKKTGRQSTPKLNKKDRHLSRKHIVMNKGRYKKETVRRENPPYGRRQTKKWRMKDSQEIISGC